MNDELLNKLYSLVEEIKRENERRLVAIESKIDSIASQPSTDELRRKIDEINSKVDRLGA